MNNNFDAIYFDMDGTIADLFNYDNWEYLLRSENTTPYQKASPLVDMEQLNAILTLFKTFDITIGVISWGAMNASNKYNQETRKVKKQWIERYLPCVDEFHVVKYGTPKHQVAKVKSSILVDDNESVRNDWPNGHTIDASNGEKMMQTLLNMLAEMLDS